MKQILLVVSLISVSLLNQNALAEEAPDELKALCRDEKVALRTLSDLRRLVDSLNRPGHNCSERVRGAISELHSVASGKSVCTMDQANRITQFADKHLRDSTHMDRDGDKLPRSLVEFAIAYGMRVSGLCSRHAMEEFAPWAEIDLMAALGVSKYRQLKHYFIDELPVNLILAPIVKTGEIVLPSDLFQATPGLATRVGVHLANSRGFEELQRLCNNQLQPLYEPILLPLARLIRAGFNNRDRYYRRFFRRYGRFWSAAVFMCETLKMIELDEPNDLDKSDQSQQQDQLAAELREAAKGLNQEVGPEFKALELNTERPIEAYESQLEVGDKIYDKSLNSLVKAFNANKSQVERLKERLRARSFNLFIRLIRKGSFRPLVKKLLRTITCQRDKELEEARKAMIKLMEAPTSDSLTYRAFKLTKDVLYAAKFTVFAMLVIIYTIIVAPSGAVLEALTRGKVKMDPFFSDSINWMETWAGVGD